MSATRLQMNGTAVQKDREVQYEKHYDDNFDGAPRWTIARQYSQASRFCRIC
jgi:hypothetical protein